MNIEQIEAFIYVSMTGNFSKAGEILYISQPSISARIKSLEMEIGYPLFKRSGKNVSLTNEGVTFLPYAKTVLQNMENGILAIQQRNSKTEGELGFSTVLTVANYLLPDIISEFYSAFPEIKLIVHTGHSHNVLDMVLKHEVPIGISREVRHPEIESIHLLNDEMILATYPGHPLFLRKTVSLHEVANENFILFNRGSLDGNIINNTFNNLKVKPKVVLEVDNIELVKHMVKKQMGIGILPQFSIKEELQENELSLVKISNIPHLSRPIQLIHLKETKIEGMLKIFVDFLLNNLNRIAERKQAI